jgi:subtilisin family serine protease
MLRPLPAGQSPPTSRTERPTGPLWNIEMIKADKAWEAANARGAGIVIGTSDSGVDGTHPALESAFRGGDDSWYDPWNGTTRPTDHNGHGTHTLGTALGRDGIGVAPEASWIGCVNLDRNLGSPARYLDCLQFMLAPFPHAGDPFRDGRPERAAHVLTNSWGCPVVEGCARPDLLRPAINALTAAGIFVVAAAGNTGDAGCGSITDEPATDPEAMTVGAVTRTGAVASFSSRGPVAGNPDSPGAVKPDVLAPGTGIVSAAPGGGYRAESGTSMATPHVAGVVALMWSANPRLVGDITRTADILRSTAGVGGLTSSANERECGDPRNLRGAGLVDALAAVTAARAIGP